MAAGSFSYNQTFGWGPWVPLMAFDSRVSVHVTVFPVQDVPGAVVDAQAQYLDASGSRQVDTFTNVRGGFSFVAGAGANDFHEPKLRFQTDLPQNLLIQWSATSARSTDVPIRKSRTFPEGFVDVREVDESWIRHGG